MEDSMEWKESFGMEYGRCSEWNGMEDCLPYFHTNYIDIRPMSKLTTKYIVLPN